MSSCAIGIDVGGTKTAAGIVAFPGGEVRARAQVPTSGRRGGEAVLGDVLRLGEDLASRARGMGLTVAGIGVGVCELVDLAGDVVSANCIAWKGLSVRERLSRVAPAVVEADVRAAALGEALFGAGRPYRTFVYVTVGTGISSCLVIDGKPYPGARGAAGTFASSPLPRGDESRSAQGSPPHGPGPSLEDLASGPALAARYDRQAPGRAASAEDVLAAAAGGDAGAAAIVRSAGEALGAGIGWLVNVLDPEAVVIGGGLGLAGGLFREAVTDSARRHVWSEIHRGLPIVSAGLGADAGIVGAAAGAWRSVEAVR